MNLVQRYIFRKLAGAFLVAFPALSLTIWATQALRELDLVTDRGQAIAVFMQATLLLVPGLILIIAPVTMLIVVVFTVNGLNSDSELISLNASGTPPAILLRPILALAIPVTLVAVVCSLYLNPLAARSSNVLVAQVNANVLGSLIRPGQFHMLGDDVVIEVGDVHTDGSFEDLFVFDRRQADQTVSYVARSGALIDGPDGKYLLMQNGVVQRKQANSDSVSVIQFVSYPFDLSALANRAGAALTQPNERGLGYLIHPDPSDPIYQANPFRYLAELHNRLNVPLYVLVLALVPAGMLGMVRSARQSRIWITTRAAALSTLLLGCNLYFGGALEHSAGLLPLVYGIPILAIVLPVLSLLTGRGLRFPRLWRRGDRRVRSAARPA